MKSPFNLTKRLQTILDQTPFCEEFWDIGCDHGLLGLQALASGKAKKVHLVDTSSGAIASLEAKLRSPKYFDWWKKNAERVVVHQCVGEEVASSVTGVLAIAGMGGETMVSILKQVKNADLILLNPFSHFEELEYWLEANTENIKASIIDDRGKSYKMYEVKIYL